MDGQDLGKYKWCSYIMLPNDTSSYLDASSVEQATVILLLAPPKLDHNTIHCQPLPTTATATADHSLKVVNIYTCTQITFGGGGGGGGGNSSNAHIQAPRLT